MAQNPFHVMGGANFVDLISQTRFGNLCNASNRWAWVTSQMIPFWQQPSQLITVADYNRAYYITKPDTLLFWTFHLGKSFISNLILLCMLAACGRSPSTPTTRAAAAQPRDDVVWNFDKGHSVEDIGWLTELNPDTYFTDQINANVTIKLQGKIDTFPVESAQFARSASTLKSIDLSLPDESLENAYYDAKEIARVWDLPISTLDDWHILAKKDSHAHGISARNDLRPAINLELFSSYDDEKPWYIHFMIVWP